MTINKIGDDITIFGTLLVNNVPTDPNTLRLDIIDPAATTTSYIFGVDPEIVRDDVGQFHFLLLLTQPGIWTYEWYSNASLTAFNTDTIEVATAVTINSVDDQDTPAAVPFVTLKVYDGDAVEVDLQVSQQRTDGNGALETQLPPGSYRVVGSKLNWIYPALNVDVIGTAPFVITLPGRLMVTRWLQWEDLDGVVDKATVDRLFQDDNSGTRDMLLIEQVIQSAEALAESKLLRSWDRAAIAVMAAEDAAIRMQAAWIALELASERRQEFIAADGKGRFWAQYERAIDFFDALSKSKSHSRGEVKEKSANTGGERRPEVKVDRDPFIFAPTSKNPIGPGGF